MPKAHLKHRAELRNTTQFALDVRGQHGEVVHIAPKAKAIIVHPDRWFAPGQVMPKGVLVRVEGRLVARYPLTDGQDAGLSPAHKEALTALSPEHREHIQAVMQKAAQYKPPGVSTAAKSIGQHVPTVPTGPDKMPLPQGK